MRSIYDNRTGLRQLDTAQQARYCQYVRTWGALDVGDHLLDALESFASMRQRLRAHKAAFLSAKRRQSRLRYGQA